MLYKLIVDYLYGIDRGLLNYSWFQWVRLYGGFGHLSIYPKLSETIANSIPIVIALSGMSLLSSLGGCYKNIRFYAITLAVFSLVE